MAERLCSSLSTYSNFENFKDSSSISVLSDTEAALLYLRDTFPKRDDIRFPPLHFLHQVYSIVKNKTKVDKEANELQLKGKIVLYKLGCDEDNVAELVAFTQDIKKHILNHSDSKVVLHFVDNILTEIKNVYVGDEDLKNTFSVSKENLRELIQEGILVLRDVGSYWLSFPRAGEFMKCYNLGRREILQIIKKSKYSEILESELKKRKLGKKSVLGMPYHIADIIGSESVKCIHTTSGLLLRIDS